MSDMDNRVATEQALREAGQLIDDAFGFSRSDDDEHSAERVLWRLVDAEAFLEDAKRWTVMRMRNAGVSWATIAEGLGVTKQAAQQKYGRWCG